MIKSFISHTAVVLMATHLGFSQKLVKEVRKLKSHEEKACYWELILSTDQAYRNGTFKGYTTGCNIPPAEDKAGVDSVDCLNMKRTLLMLNYHGFPTIAEFPPHIETTPSVIFIHQASPEIRERYFPLLLRFYQNGECSLSEIKDVLGNIYFDKHGSHTSIEDDASFERILNELKIDASKFQFNESEVLTLCSE